ncbi:MAG: Ppx/GppA family phosphatase, partial [Pseudomonadota bacterium]
CEATRSQSLESLSRIPEISRRRLETLPTAAVVLERLILASGVKRLSVSAAGLREGVLYDNLSPDKRALDPLAEGAREFGRRLSPNLAFAKAAARFTAPLFSDETPEEARLREAACSMVDIGAFLHPDHRDFPSYTNILHAPLTGIDHPGRVFVALAIFHRYAGRREPPKPAASERILTTDERRRAMLLGLTLRLAGSVAPKSGKSLDGCRLERTSDELIFSLEPEVRPLFGEVEERRLSTLAGELGLNPVVRTIDETAARRTG